MLRPAALLRVFNEIIFIFLGSVLVWLGLGGRVMFNPRSTAWLALSAVLVYWGARAWVKTERAPRTSERTVTRLGGASLALVGLMMLSLTFVQFRWVGIVLALAGAILMLRGAVGAFIAFRAT